MSEQQVFYTELNKKNLSQSQHNRTNNNRSKKSGEEEEKLKPHRSSQQKSKPERLNGKETREQQVTYSELNKERLDLPWKDQKSKGTKGRTSVSEQSVTYTELKLHNQPQSDPAARSFYKPLSKPISKYHQRCRKNWGDSKSACAAQNSSLLWIDNQEEQVFLAFFSLYAWIGLSHNEPGNSWKWEDGTDFSNHQLTLIKIQTEGNCVFRSARYDYEGNCEDLKFFVCKWRTHS
ncbi:NKG2-D type II integral membrane protein-like isoform X2 [Ornithorhynchus anatinus]|uniref:C-type lectin domain-containing protein n=1 Tax=Ornithorhynchus anatinus TaxID=9258 RepID=A0A6I8NNZ3_ORNAN|nr:NKG2-D type II integral membrane protein-like isoform X2 [Ornithorhynchus anatinus]